MQMVQNARLVWAVSFDALDLIDHSSSLLQCYDVTLTKVSQCPKMQEGVITFLQTIFVLRNSCISISAELNQLLLLLQLLLLAASDEHWMS